MRRLLRLWLPLLGLLILLPSGGAAQESPRVQVHVIDVGQADAILITNDAKTCTILIDAGDTRYPGSSKHFKDYLTGQLSPGSPIDLVIATHPHNDHIGSMAWVLRTYQAKAYIDNGQPYTTQLYKTLMTVVKEQQKKGLKYYPFAMVPAAAETPCGNDGPRLQVLYPRQGFDPAACKANPNNCSVVSRITVGNTRVLFPGDAEHEEEALLLADPEIRPALAAEVLKVGHHGSDTASGADFLAAIQPSWFVISAGKEGVGTNVGYKHPRLSTILTLLQYAGDKTDPITARAYDAAARAWTPVETWGHFYLTPRDGTIVLSTDGVTIRKE